MICEVCDSKNIKKIIDLGDQPLCDDLIKIGSKKKSKKFETQIYFCLNCYTALHKTQIAPKILFPKNYHYRAKFTKDVLRGMKDLVNETINIVKKKKLRVLDIGCNDGSLLNFFKIKGFKTYGIEPTNAFKEAQKNHIIMNSYFNSSTAKSFLLKYGNPDIITFTNVFAHIKDLKSLLINLKILLKTKTILIIENHYLKSVIKNNQFDTFYHEHPRTYSLKSFIYVAKFLNLEIFKVQFPKRYGGNIRVYLGNKKKFKFLKKHLKEEQQVIKQIFTLKDKIKRWKKNKTLQLKKMNLKFGPLPAKAFPGRASILINLLGLTQKQISKVYEQNNSKKIGHYIPGTRIPIGNDNGLKKINYKVPLINFSWHISSEIRRYLIKNKIKNKLIDIVSPKDFL